MDTVPDQAVSATSIRQQLDNNNISLEDNIVIPIVTTSNIDTIEDLQASDIDVKMSPIQIGEIPTEPIIASSEPPVPSLSDIVIPEIEPEVAVILLPADLTQEDVQKVLAALPVQNDVVDVYQGSTLLLDNVAVSDLENVKIPEVVPTNETLDDIIDTIKDSNIIPVISNSNIDLINQIQSSIPAGKVSTVVIDDIPPETLDTIQSIAASVPSVKELDEVEMTIAPPKSDELVIILPPSSQEEIAKVLSNVHQENITLIVGSTVIADNQPVASAIEIVYQLTAEEVENTKVVNVDALNTTLAEKSNAHIKPIISKDNAEVVELLSDAGIKAEAPVVVEKPRLLTPTIVENIEDIGNDETQQAMTELITDNLIDISFVKTTPASTTITTSTARTTTVSLTKPPPSTVVLFPADMDRTDIAKVLEDLPVSTNLTVVVGSTVVAINQQPDEIEITEELLQDVQSATVAASDIVEKLASIDISLEDNVIIPIVTSNNVDTIDELVQQSDAQFTPIQIGEIPTESIIDTGTEPIVSLSDIAIPEAKPEAAVILLPEDLSPEEVKTVLATLPIENDVVDVYQGATLLLDGIAASDLETVEIPTITEPSNDTIEHVLETIKNENIIPVINSDNVDVIDAIHATVPDGKVSAVVIGDIPAEAMNKIDNVAASVPNIEKLDSQLIHIVPAQTEELVIILPPSTQEEINAVLQNIAQDNVTLIVGSTVIADNKPVSSAIEIVGELTDDEIENAKIVNLDALNETLTEKSDARIKPIISKDNVQVADFLDTSDIKTEKPVVLEKPRSFVPTIVEDIKDIGAEEATNAITAQISDNIEQLVKATTVTTTTTTLAPTKPPPVGCQGTPPGPDSIARKFSLKK